MLGSYTTVRDLTASNVGTGSSVAILATNGTTQTLLSDVTANALGTGHN